jgi:murein DD-endopeptidase MepM/ murein hydrolase activator NlpD
MGTPRYVNLAHPLTLGSLALASALIAGGAFFLGSHLGQKTAMSRPVVQSAALTQELAKQQAQIDEARQHLQENNHALAKRVGLMNAHVIRLDALGQRLTQMAKIDAQEFNFGEAPAQGGPEIDSHEGVAPQVPDLNTMIDQLGRDLQSREVRLGALENVLMTHKLNEQILPDGRPVTKGWISSHFGRRSDPFTGYTAFHKGVDFAGREGAPVVSVAAGVVTWSRDRFGYGKMVEVNHGNGYSTRYAHNARNLVKVGDTIRKGQAVALMGSTGRATGPNLHFEVLKNGQQVNPLKFIGGER